LTALSFGVRHTGWFRQQRALQHFVMRQSSLHKHAPAAGSRTHNSRCTNEQRHRFFRSSVARSQQFLVEIEECNHISFVNAMQRGLGTNNDSGSRSTSVGTAFGRKFGNWLTSQCFKFFPNPIHASAQILHFRSATFRAQHWAHRAAPETHK
jgi:hypothetical protein